MNVYMDYNVSIKIKIVLTFNSEEYGTIRYLTNRNKIVKKNVTYHSIQYIMLTMTTYRTVK